MALKVLVELDADGTVLTYLAPPTVKIGSCVQVTVNEWWRDGLVLRNGKIIALTSDYAGPCKSIKRVL